VFFPKGSLDWSFGGMVTYWLTCRTRLNWEGVGSVESVLITVGSVESLLTEFKESRLVFYWLAWAYSRERATLYTTGSWSGKWVYPVQLMESNTTTSWKYENTMWSWRRGNTMGSWRFGDPDDPECVSSAQQGSVIPITWPHNPTEGIKRGQSWRKFHLCWSEKSVNGIKNRRYKTKIYESVHPERVARHVISSYASCVR
jgi:hypothetical protein